MGKGGHFGVFEGFSKRGRGVGRKKKGVGSRIYEDIGARPKIGRRFLVLVVKAVPPQCRREGA